LSFFNGVFERFLCVSVLRLWGAFIDIEYDLRIRHGVCLKHKLRLLCLQLRFYSKMLLVPLWIQWQHHMFGGSIVDVLACFWCIDEVCSEPKTFTRLNVKWFGKATLSIFGKITFYTYGIILG
jgi:hypothetical protein